jgi:hypothetical protein
LETTVAIVGGIGFFLLGMAVMTDGLKALAGSALRGVLAKATSTSLSGTVWGAVAKVGASLGSPDERRAEELYTDAMRSAAKSATLLEHVTVQHSAATPDDATLAKDIEHLARCSSELAGLRTQHRHTMLESVAAAKLTASDAIAIVDAVRLLDQSAHHAWRAAAYLAGAVT